MTGNFYIAAKAPRPGLAKTRLGRAIGHRAAVVLYKAFLSDLAARFARTPLAPVWFVTPADAWPDIAPLVEEPTRDRGDNFRVQAGADWTERQRRLFLEATARGEERILLIASDSPHLTTEVIEEAFRELERRDLVFGPTDDGGYYLIGMRATAVPHDVLGGVPMSTDTVLGDLVDRAGRAGLSVGWTETTFDIDEAADLAHLRRLTPGRPDLAATYAVLAEIGLGTTPEARSLTGAREPAPDDGAPGRRNVEAVQRSGLRFGAAGRGRSSCPAERAQEERGLAW